MSAVGTPMRLSIPRKQFYLDMERRWLLLARSRAFAEQLSSFVKAARPPKP
jgi:hypothetical protein